MLIFHIVFNLSFRPYHPEITRKQLTQQAVKDSIIICPTRKDEMSLKSNFSGMPPTSQPLKCTIKTRNFARILKSSTL